MKRLIQGNEAIFQGALEAGASFFAGYPITPSTEILLLAAQYAVENPSFKFLQSEDEIAAINAVIGASFAGAKAFTATAGPGFSLMQEAIGYAHMTERPLVIVEIQRVGPATGMPTMPAQGDILQCAYGSAGDYYPIALYPTSMKECYQYTVAAFNAAEESSSPVILLSDAFTAHLNEVVELEQIPVEVAPRHIPPVGTGQRFYSGLAHDPQGYPKTADADIYQAWLKGVKERHTKVAAKYNLFKYRENPESDTLLIASGIVSRVASALADHFALFTPIRIHPMLSDELREVARKYRRIVVAEANDGQYALMVEAALRRRVLRVPLLGGRISLEVLKQGLRQVLRREVA